MFVTMRIRRDNSLRFLAELLAFIRAHDGKPETQESVDMFKDLFRDNGWGSLLNYSK